MIKKKTVTTIEIEGPWPDRDAVDKFRAVCYAIANGYEYTISPVFHGKFLLVGTKVHAETSKEFSEAVTSNENQTTKTQSA